MTKTMVRSGGYSMPSPVLLPPVLVSTLLLSPVPDRSRAVPDRADFSFVSPRESSNGTVADVSMLKDCCLEILGEYRVAYEVLALCYR